MDSCKKDVIIACGLYLRSEAERREKRKYWINNVFRGGEGQDEINTLFGRLKDDGRERHGTVGACQEHSTACVN
jgi:hypothetical protein